MLHSYCICSAVIFTWMLHSYCTCSAVIFLFAVLHFFSHRHTRCCCAQSPALPVKRKILHNLWSKSSVSAATSAQSFEFTFSKQPSSSLFISSTESAVSVMAISIWEMREEDPVPNQLDKCLDGLQPAEHKGLVLDNEEKTVTEVCVHVSLIHYLMS